MTPLLVDLAQRKLPESIGAKARNLRRLRDYGLRVPHAQVCCWEAHARYVQDDPTLIDQLQAELTRRLDHAQAYAVRSSADVEDGQAHSFAGQFKTVLDVSGVPAILQALWSIWASAQAPAGHPYRTRSPRAAPVRMAVILQAMVPPVVSGVAFSKNPLTGLDEIVVEAVTGPGTRLVQEGVTPHRWVHKWGAWLQQPAAPDFDPALIAAVVAGTKAVARQHPRPVDLEWVYDGRTLHWVQLREITSLRGLPLFSNRISRELLPGLIKPLVWSVNVPLVNGAWTALLTELIGPHQIDPLELAKAFYYRAYFNMGRFGDILELLGLPRETLELMLGLEATGPEKPRFRPSTRTYRLLPRMVGFALKALTLDQDLADFLPRQWAAFRAAPAAQAGRLSAAELLAEIDRLYAAAQRTARYNILVPLLMQVYNRLLRAQLVRRGLAYEHLDLTEGLAGWDAVSPSAGLDELRRAAARLTPAQRAALAGGAKGQDDFQPALVAFLERFGHFSDNGNDFSAVPWREQPALIRQLALAEIAPAEPAGGRLRWADLPLSAGERLWLTPLFRRAGRYRLYREQVSSLYTYGYGLFRVFFLELGERLVRQGRLPARNDIFYLTLAEVRAALQPAAGPEPDLASLARTRRGEMEAVRDWVPPETIYGETPLPLRGESSAALRGTPTSGGYYAGRARAVRGLGDFDKLQPGDVLVIPYADVGWTPLFAQAGAVVAESGGMLSHSSIVAREYGLPAVVSLPEACRLLDGAWVAVDGYRGEVRRLPEPSLTAGGVPAAAQEV